MSTYFVHFLIHYNIFPYYDQQIPLHLPFADFLSHFRSAKIIICLCCWLFSAFRVSKRRISYLLLTFYLTPGQQISPFLPFADLLPRSESANAAFLTFCWPFTSFRVSKLRISYLLLTFYLAPSQQTQPFSHFADLLPRSGSANISFLTICWPFHALRVSKRRLSHILLTFPNASIQQPPRIFHFADLSTLAGSASNIKKYICWQKIITTGAVRAQDPGPHRQFHKFLNN